MSSTPRLLKLIASVLCIPSSSKKLGFGKNTKGKGHEKSFLYKFSLAVTRLLDQKKNNKSNSKQKIHHRRIFFLRSVHDKILLRLFQRPSLMQKGILCKPYKQQNINFICRIKWIFFSLFATHCNVYGSFSFLYNNTAIQQKDCALCT